ncbi:zinc finger protein ZAT9-like [Impatiens glandulifera]|uniref:zinc finger protein ZAT9-like n=1 Tax=Impatiens glandulifera TaxID=253017 RepID=UPI001FB16E4B|nr:zinc finger protein ZAT9-like [Impatiens glandulifera]
MAKDRKKKEDSSSSSKITDETCKKSKSLSGHKRVHSQASSSKWTKLEDISNHRSIKDYELKVHNQASSSKSKIEDISNEDRDRLYRRRMKYESEKIFMANNIQEILKNSQMGFEDLISDLSENPHSSENVCKICKRKFDSMRALCGHMRHHPKEFRKGGTEQVYENLLENCETFCPVKKKRSKPMYTVSSSSSCSSSVYEFNEDEEEAAECLIMLSTGITNWDEFKAFLKQTNDHENPILNRKEEKSTVEVGLNSSNGIQKKKEEQKIRSLRIFSSSSGTMAILTRDEANPTQQHVQQLEENQNPNEMMESDMIKKHQCTTCFRYFPSGQALGGHKRAHYKKPEEENDLVVDRAPL